MKILMPMLAVAALTACSSTSEPDGIDVPQAGSPAVITVVFPAHPADTLRVLASDSATIVQAMRFVQSGQGPRVISGRIVRGSGNDGRYPFHFLPETVRLVDVGIEICDGALMRTEAEVTEFFVNATGSASSPFAQWCPWDSRPVRVDAMSS